MGGERFDPDLLDEEDPFEIDTQAAHLLSIRTWESTISTTCGPAIRCSTQPSRPRTGSCAARSAAGCSWCRWLARAAAIRAAAARSAVTRHQPSSQPSTGETDDEHAYDTRPGI